MTAEEAPEITRRPSLWRNREFVALWSGQVVSNLGVQISATALPLLVLATTGSPADAGLVGAAGTLPFLLCHLPAGPVVDRWNRRRILLASEIAAGLALATIPIAMWLGVLTIPQLLVVAFTQGLCLVFFGLAERAALPMIVPTSLLATALAQNEARSRGAALAGPPLGGLLFGLGKALPFMVTATAYLASTVGLLIIRRDLQVKATAPAESLWRATTAGLRWIWRNPLVRAAILLIAASNLVFQALILVLIVLAKNQGADAARIGLMLGIYSGGGLIGALAASKFHSRFTPKTVIIGVNWIWAAILPLLTVATDPLQIGAVGALSAFLGPLWNVVIITYTTLLVPNELLGRVTSAAMTLSWGVMPIAALTAGYLLDSFGPITAVWVLAAIMCVTAITATVSPAVRNAPPLPTRRTGLTRPPCHRSSAGDTEPTGIRACASRRPATVSHRVQSVRTRSTTWRSSGMTTPFSCSMATRRPTVANEFSPESDNAMPGPHAASSDIAAKARPSRSNVHVEQRAPSG